MGNGWIKLHRKFVKWEWFHNSEMVHLFLYLVLSANHEPGRWQGQDIARGQLVTGRFTLSENTGISQQTIRTCLGRLKSTSELTIKSTNKYSIITILKYEDYQKDERKSTSTSTSKSTNNQPTTNHKQELKKNKKEYSTEQSSLIAEVIKLFEDVNPACKRMYGNTTQRQACNDLLDTYGFEEVSKVIAFLPKSNKVTYFPTITTPLQLWDKYQMLKDKWSQKKLQTNNGRGIA